jgi:hypothetical protein
MFIVKVILGVAFGALGGYLLYRFIGCQSGACPITSNPYASVIYGIIVGLLVALSRP